MGYEIHIERDNCAQISLDEWCAAVAATEGLRLTTKDAVARNPTTGEVIRISRNDGDVEVYFPEEDAWFPCVRYDGGRISFRPGNGFDEPGSQFRRAMVRLAMQLNALVVGQDGEVYT